MISTRRFHRMIDEYVTGLHGEKLQKEIEKIEEMRREEDYWLYVNFLKDLSFDDALTLDDSILLDWLALSERRLPA